MRRDKNGHVYSDAELSEIFVAIGRRKENVARGILEEKRQQEAARRDKLLNRLGIGESPISDDEDLDEADRILSEKIARVKAGELWQYGNSSTESGSGEVVQHPEPGPDKTEVLSGGDMPVTEKEGQGEEFPEETVPQQPLVRDETTEFVTQVDADTPSEQSQTDIPEIVLGGPEKKQETPREDTLTAPTDGGVLDLVLEGPVQEIGDFGVKSEVQSLPENSDDIGGTSTEEPEIVLEGPAEDDDTVRAYIAIEYDGEYGAYAFTVTARTDEGPISLSRESCLMADRKETAVFMAANQLLKEVKKMTEKNELFSAVIYAEPSVCSLLKRTATYGFVGKYGKPALTFVQMSRELAAQCFVRIADDSEAVELMQVTGQAKSLLLTERD